MNGEEQTDENMDGKSCTKGLDFSERLCQSIFREEVAWALEKVKRDTAPGKDGVTVDMMSAESASAALSNGVQCMRIPAMYADTCKLKRESEARPTVQNIYSVYVYKFATQSRDTWPPSSGI